MKKAKTTKPKKHDVAKRTHAKKIVKKSPKIDIETKVNKIYIADYITLEAQADLLVDLLLQHDWQLGRIFDYSEIFIIQVKIMWLS